MNPHALPHYEAAVQNTVLLYQAYDRVVVSFSGGKDSGVLLEVAIEAARRTGKLPVEVMHIDCEVSTPETVAYVQRTAARPEVLFHWYCLPLKVENGFSLRQEYFVRWDPEQKSKWFRPLPAQGITEVPWFTGRGFKKFTRAFASKTTSKGATAVQLVGVRAEESLLRTMASERGWVFPQSQRLSWAYPIAHLLVEDVWSLVRHHGWDYNRTYDVMQQHGIPMARQRVGVVAKREAIHEAAFWERAYPHLMPALLRRVDGLAEVLQGPRTLSYDLPAEQPTYEAWADALLEQFAPDLRTVYADGLMRHVRYHERRTADIIPDAAAHPDTGLSWRFICRCLLKRDMRGDLRHQLIAEREGARKRTARIHHYATML